METHSYFFSSHELNFPVNFTSCRCPLLMVNPGALNSFLLSLFWFSALGANVYTKTHISVGFPRWMYPFFPLLRTILEPNAPGQCLLKYLFKKKKDELHKYLCIKYMASAAAGSLKTQPHLRWDGRRPPNVVCSLHKKEWCIISRIRAEIPGLPCCNGQVVATNNTSGEAEYLLLSAGCSTGSAEALRWNQPLVCTSWEAAPSSFLILPAVTSSWGLGAAPGTALAPGCPLTMSHHPAPPWEWGAITQRPNLPKTPPDSAKQLRRFGALCMGSDVQNGSWSESMRREKQRKSAKRKDDARWLYDVVLYCQYFSSNAIVHAVHSSHEV